MSLSKNINPSLVLVQPRKTRPFITERLLMGRKESNQTNKQNFDISYQDLSFNASLQLFFQNLTDANDLLQNEVNKLKYQLEEATQQMDRTAEDYAKLKVVCFSILIFTITLTLLQVQGPRLQQIFILNSAEHETYPAHKC